MTEQERCARCDKPVSFCVCDRVTPQPVRTRVLILQHPQEQDRDLGTASLVLAMVPTAQKVVGLSWASLAHCLGEESVDPKRWAVLYPNSLKRPLTPAELTKERLLLDRDGARHHGAHLEGIVVIDGSWSQAKALWWRNAWFLKLGRVVLHPKEPTIYGKLRRAPRKEALSTLESVAEALVANGEPEAVRAEMRKTFRTMMQRVRDALAKDRDAVAPEAPEAPETPDGEA